MKTNKCLIGREKQSVFCRSGPVDILTCVYPQVDLEVMGCAEGLATVEAVLGRGSQVALTMLGQSWLNGPRRLPCFFTDVCSAYKEEETNENVLNANSKQAHANITINTVNVFFFPPVCLLLSLFFLTQMCQRYTKSNASNGFKRWADRMLTFYKLFYRNTTVLRYTLNSNTLKTTNAFPLSSCFFLLFLSFLSSLPLCICWIAVKQKKEQCKIRERKHKKEKDIVDLAMSALQDLHASLPAT